MDSMAVSQKPEGNILLHRSLICYCKLPAVVNVSLCSCLFYFFSDWKMLKISDLHCVISNNNHLYSLFFVFDNFQVTDDRIIRRQIILTTFTKEMKAKVYSGFVPIRLSSSWEHFNINLAKVTNALFGTKYVETEKIKVSQLLADLGCSH